jgi:integrase
MLNIANSRVSSPLPEILFEDECTRLLTAASHDPRTYLLFLLFLETGIKLEELFGLKVSHFDFSNRYAPEMMIKHTGKKEKKSRKLKLPIEILPVFTDYVVSAELLIFLESVRDRSGKKSNEREQPLRAPGSNWVKWPLC